MTSSIDHGLNPEQLAAVTHGDGPLLVLAGAGTGKTRVLTHRIAHLVDGGVPSWRVLAVTFTNKAAGEMRERLEGLLGAAAAGMWIGTFHATCARLLRRHADRVGLTRSFTIFDDDDSRRVVVGAMKELGLSDRVTPRAILSRIDRAKNEGLDPAALPARDYVDEVVRRVAPIYAERLAREDAVDFNDLLLRTLVLLDDREVGAELAGRFEHVLVDEFQDTNRVQYALVRRLAGSRNLCVVGDDDQSIYRWRGAEPRNLLEFDRDFPEAAIVKLERNYRSTGTILAAANAVIAKNVTRHAKALWTEQGAGEPIAIEETDDERAEADLVARTIAAMRAGGTRGWGDFAVLYRTHAQSRVIEETLRARRVPHRIVGGQSFFQRREVKDLTEYLRVVASPLADSAFERVVNVPTRGIGDTTVDRVRAHAREAGVSMLEAARGLAAGAGSVGAAARGKLKAFVELIDGLRELIGQGTPVATFVAAVIQRTGYAERLEIEDKVDGPDRLRNLNELVAAAAAYDAESGGESTVLGFLERVALTSASDDKDGRADGDDAGAVTLLTIHAAKGLEFPVVFLVGMEEGLFPSLKDADAVQDLEEERRLAYVAITRARARLVMTHARTRRTWDEIRRNEPSRFLADLPADLVVFARAPAARGRFSLGGRFAARRPLGPAASAAPAEDAFDQRPPGEEEPTFYLDDAGDEDAVFPKGGLVRHRIFGVGRIEAGSGRGPDRKLTIRFPAHGVKTIVARWVEKA